MSLQTPKLFNPDEGEHYAFLNTRSTIRVSGADSGGVLTVIELLAPRGFGPPLHSHQVEDELFHVTEGALWVSCGGQEQVLEVGGTAWLPKGLPHTFQAVGPQTTRVLQITTPAQFEDFTRALGAPMSHAGLPDPVQIDPGEVARVCAEFRIDVLGPPPAPLDDAVGGSMGGPSASQ